MSKQMIGLGCRVAMRFRLSLEDGFLVDAASQTEPMEWEIGDGSLIDNVEKKLFGLAVGDRQTLALPPEQAYGLVHADNIHNLPYKDFPTDLDPVPGNVYSFVTPNRSETPGTVLSVSPDRVQVDFNHPLAGHTISFEVAIVAISSPPPGNQTR